MDKLSRSERWELLKIASGKTTIPWDRMVLPTHEWMDEVRTIDSYDYDFNLHKGRVIKVPRYNNG